ncbi:serpin family protein [Streptomyces sp. NPDC002952]|uniref:serpin family protein n=1 Tax=Streptomyces sp. NPDC002952 TaxID=3364673 RepID=UPI0036C816BA
MRTTKATIRAVNGLTARWAETVSGATVFSAAGVWPLLGFLADGAGGAARAELSEAVGLPADECALRARELLNALAEVPGVAAALGLWTDRTLELREAWEAGLPAGTHGVLTGVGDTDRAALDAWAAKRTDGQIRRMPVTLTDGNELVLAGALTLRTDWYRPFEESFLCPETGPWRDLVLKGLRRTTALLDRVGVADTPHGALTELKVLGTTGVDVHLLLGEEGTAPGRVLGEGVHLLAGERTVVPGHRLPYGEAGPGVRVERERCETPRPPSLEVDTVPFALSGEHDLLRLPELFGLTTARDDREGHFPGISARPLCVGSARQSATASFGALGFRAAAVTAVEMLAAGAPSTPRHFTTTVHAGFDRPFGFLAVHRRSRLVLAAGWVDDPEPFREDEECY